MARHLSQVINTLVLIIYSIHLINCGVQNLQPGLVEVALDHNQGQTLWTAPKEVKSGAHFRLGDRVIAEVFVGNTELPWYILVPLIIVVVICELQVMLTVLQSQDLAREEEETEMYRKISLMFKVEEKKVVDANIPEEQEEVVVEKVTKKKGLHPKMPFRIARKQRSARAHAKRD